MIKAAHKPSIDVNVAKDMQDGYRIDHPKLEFTPEEIGQASYRIEGQGKGGQDGMPTPPPDTSSDEEEEPKGLNLNIKIDMSGYGY